MDNSTYQVKHWFWSQLYQERREARVIIIRDGSIPLELTVVLARVHFAIMIRHFDKYMSNWPILQQKCNRSTQLWGLLSLPNTFVKPHDYIMTRKGFPYYWPFVRMNAAHWRSFICRKNLMSTQLIFQWFQTPWGPCNITVMFYQKRPTKYIENDIMWHSTQD